MGEWEGTSCRCVHPDSKRVIAAQLDLVLMEEGEKAPV